MFKALAGFMGKGTSPEPKVKNKGLFIAGRDNTKAQPSTSPKKSGLMASLRTASNG